MPLTLSFEDDISLWLSEKPGDQKSIFHRRISEVRVGKTDES